MVPAAVPELVTDVGTIAGVVAAVGAATGVIAAGVRWAVRSVVRTEIEPLKDALGVVQHEVTYNDGTSLKDATRRIEHTVAQLVEHDR